MNGRCGVCTGCSFVMRFPGVSGQRARCGESAYGMSGSPCREVTRLHNSDAARSKEKEQQKEEGRGRVARVPERSGSVGKADRACSVDFFGTEASCITSWDKS